MNLYEILTAYSPEPTELKSVGISRISLFVSEILEKYNFSFFDLFAVKKFFSKNLKVFGIQKIVKYKPYTVTNVWRIS